MRLQKELLIPAKGRLSRGSHIKSLLAVNANEEITTIVNFKEFTDDEFLFMATANGVIKKTCIKEFANAKIRGIGAIKLDVGDRLVSTILTTGNDELVLISRRGKALRIKETDVRPMGRAGHGNKGLKLSENRPPMSFQFGNRRFDVVNL